MAKYFKFILILIFFSTISSNSQQDTTSKQYKLTDIKEVLKKCASYYKIDWQLYANSIYLDDKKDIKEYSPGTPKEISNAINKYLSDTSWQSDEQVLIGQYQSYIISMFLDLDFLGGDQEGKFFFERKPQTKEPLNIPIRICSLSDSGQCLIVTGTFIESTYNTLKMSSRERATDVIVQYILTSLKYYLKHFSINDFEYFGMCAVYGSKDFSEKYSTPHAEFISFIASSLQIDKYVKSDITEDEFINNALIYQSDADMVSEIKRIKIELK